VGDSPRFSRTPPPCTGRELALLDTLFESAPLGLAFIDLEFRFVRVNELLADINGISVEAHIGRRVRDVLSTSAMDGLEADWRRILETGEPMLGVAVSGETNAAPGQTRQWLEDWHPVEVDGRRVGILATVREVTIERETAAALRRTEERQRLMQTHANIRMWDWAPSEGRTCFATELRLLDDPGADPTITVEEWRARVHPADVARVESELGAAVAERRTFDIEFRLGRDGGDVRWIEAKGAAVYGTLGEVVRALGVNVDVTQRKVAEQALRESEHRFARLAESGIIGIAITRRDGSVLEANDAYLAMLGYTRADLRAGAVRWGDDPRNAETDARPLAELKSRGVASAWEKEKRRKDGTYMPALVAIATLDGERRIAVVADLSARKQAEAALRQSEEQLRRSQKMEAIGRLAGGVAHDFNNLLSVILSYSELLVEDRAGDVPLLADLGEVIRAARRAAELTRQLLAFSRQQVLLPRLVNLGDVLERMQKMLPRILGEDIELSIIVGSEPCTIHVDPGQIEQVVMNLAVNARDAMPDGGELTIEAGHVVVDGELASARGIVAGPHMVLSVRDTGCGMDAVTQARAFEPFFTTKGPGKGTGLGLSTVLGIVQQSGGTVWLDGNPGSGASFIMYFPPADPALVLERLTEEPSEIMDSRGTETVLLVEDEAAVRALAVKVLRRSGYRVLDAAGPGDALLLWEKHKDEIDLLLTDVVMPKMNGRQLAERLQLERHLLPVLYMSGYTDDTMLRHPVVGSELAFLPKPLTPQALTCKVREVLNACRARAPSALPVGGAETELVARTRDTVRPGRT
jgi:PAS domain S-box-containing protein